MSVKQVNFKPNSLQPGPRGGKSRFYKIISIIAVTVGVIVAGGILLIMYSLYMLGGGSHPNTAKDTMKPIHEQIMQLGAEKICTNGDNGHSLDNRQPWFTTYYSLENASIITQKITEIANTLGYSLQSDSERIENLRSDSNGGFSNVETYSDNNNYLQALNSTNSSNLRVEIVRDGSIALNCSDIDDYGRPAMPPSGGAIVELSITYPNTN